MKVISKKGVPEIEFGDKVRLLAESSNGDLHAGDVGVVVDLDGGAADVQVHTPDDWDYVAATDLEVLQKFETGVTAVVEFTSGDIVFISEILNKSAVGPIQREFEKLKAEVA